jgi:multicomponent Na+:H+ antiporter subunit E
MVLPAVGPEPEFTVGLTMKEQREKFIPALKTALRLALALAVLWLALSGHTEPLILVLGALSVAFVIWLAMRMNVVDRESYPFGRIPRLLVYWPWLLIEILKSGFDVTRRAIGPASAVRPLVFDVEASQVTDLGLVIHANSITLTPGTVSLDTAPGLIRVHALHPDIAKDLKKSDMDARVPDGERAT